MRKITAYLAISLDGKIAKPDGDVSWLDEIPNPENSDFGYKAFYSSIDTTIMGNETYRMVLGFGVDFPYSDKQNFVITRDHRLTQDENVTFISGNVEKWAGKLKGEKGKDIWLIGGGQMNTLFLNAGLLDELHVHVMPLVLGDGIPLFSDKTVHRKMDLQSERRFQGGVVELIYKLKNNE
ncbi:MAG: dihydrofolate reductase family protein [Cyclobacteriaceae bacterium]